MLVNDRFYCPIAAAAGHIPPEYGYGNRGFRAVAISPSDGTTLGEYSVASYNYASSGCSGGAAAMAASDAGDVSLVGEAT